MEDYYNTLLKHLDGYTVMGLFEGKRDINDIVTLQTGHKGRVFFFDQEPMIKGTDDKLWDYIFQEPTIFANSELDSADKEYLKNKYPNFIDWYFFSHGLVAREWFAPQQYNYSGWENEKKFLFDCNLFTGPRQYRLYVIYNLYKKNLGYDSYISFNGHHNWIRVLRHNDIFGLLDLDDVYRKIPNLGISYDNWGADYKNFNGFMQTTIPIEAYNKVHCVLVGETLFTENKKHLTEKVFKPISAGKPFVLFAGKENLKYLKSYGFETFDQQWSEDYDNILDPKQRIDKIFEVLESKFDSKNNLNLKLINQAHEVAFKNRKYFWSDKFYNRLINEAIENLEIAKIELSSKRI